jgi:hypothetical protein
MGGHAATSWSLTMTSPVGLRAQLEGLAKVIERLKSTPPESRTYADVLELRSLEQQQARLTDQMRASGEESIEVSFEGGDRVSHAGIDSGLFGNFIKELRSALAAGALTVIGEPPGVRIPAEGFRYASPKLAYSRPGSFTALLIGPREAEFPDVGRTPFSEAALAIISALGKSDRPPEEFVNAIAPLGGRSARAVGEMLGYLGKAKTAGILRWHPGAGDEVRAKVAPDRARMLNALLTHPAEEEEPTPIDIHGLLGEASVFANRFEIRNAQTGQVYRGGVPAEQLEALRAHFGTQCEVRLFVRTTRWAGGLEAQTYTLDRFLD